MLGHYTTGLHRLHGRGDTKDRTPEVPRGIPHYARPDARYPNFDVRCRRGVAVGTLDPDQERQSRDPNDPAKTHATVYPYPAAMNPNAIARALPAKI